MFRKAILRQIGALTFAAMVLLAAAGPATAYTRAELLDRARQIEFTGNKTFMDYKKATHRGLDAQFDWSDDGCSVPTAVKFIVPATGIGSYVFDSQCKQHDFGWRNFGNGLTLSRSWWTKIQIDWQFNVVMGDRCGAWWIRYSGQEPACRLTASAFYGAVSVAPW